MDQAHLETDKIIEKIAKRLNREYKTANKDMEKKLEKYLKAFDRKDRAKRDLLKQGLISEQEYKDWRIGQIMIGKRWEEMLDTLAQDYHNTNEIARQIAKDNAYDVYALNHDYGTFQVEKESLVDTSYTLYDRATVSRLAKEDQKMLPDPSERTLKRIRDAKEKRWSKQKLNSAIMQGILQGESLAKVAKRLQSVTNMEKAQAMRNARTMMTNAQSAGRYDAYRRAKGMGIDFKVVWIATLDNRTRHEHRQLDGQMQDVDTPFEVDGQKIMYPADLGGSGYKVPPELIYNCRCTIGAAIPGTKLYEQGLQGVDRFSRLGDMSYEEWKNEHAKIMDPNTGELLVEPDKFEDIIKRIQDRVAKKGMIEESDLMEAGSAVANEVHSIKALQKAEYEKAEKEYKDFLKKENIEKLEADRMSIYQQAMQHPWNSKERNELLGESFRLKGKIHDIKYGDKYQRFRKAKEDYYGESQGNAGMLKGVLSRIRKMGTDSIPQKELNAHLCNSRSSMKKIVLEAYSYYPTEWVEKSMVGRLQPSKVKRGYYDGWNICISGDAHWSQFETATHELGHRFEDINRDILADEKAFYERRTKGEELKWLGKGYGRSEVTRKDNFISPYMGKDYGGRAYELVSMGFQYAYNNPVLLATDPDMESWIYGILALR